MVEENTCTCQQSPMLAEKIDTMHKNKTFNPKTIQILKILIEIMIVLHKIYHYISLFFFLYRIIISPVLAENIQN